MARISIAMTAMLFVLGGCGLNAPPTLLSKGKELFKTGQYQDAVASCTAAINENPEEYEAYNYRGRAYHCLGQIDQAIVDFGHAIRIAPQDPEAYFLRAIAYKEKGEKRLAIMDEIKGRRLDPTYEHAYLSRPEANTHTRVNVSDSPTASAIDAEDDLPSFGRANAGSHRKTTSVEKKGGGGLLGTTSGRQADRLEADRGAPAPVKDAYGLQLETDTRSQTEQLLGIAISHGLELPSGTSPNSEGSASGPRSRPRTESQDELSVLGRPPLSDNDLQGPLAPEPRGAQGAAGRGGRQNTTSPRSRPAGVPKGSDLPQADVGGAYSNPYGPPNPSAPSANPYAPRSPYAPNTNPYAPRSPYAPNSNPFAPRNSYSSRNGLSPESPYSARPRYPTGTPAEPYLPPVRPEPGTRDDFGY